MPEQLLRHSTVPAAGDRVPDWVFENRFVSVEEQTGIPFPVDLSHLRDFRTAWVLSLVLGVFGADRFYLRRPFTGTLKLLTLGGLGAWWLWDLASIITGRVTDGGGHGLTGSRSHRFAAGAFTAFYAAAVAASLAAVALPAASTTAETAAAGLRSAVLARVNDTVTPSTQPVPPAPSWQVAARADAGRPAAALHVKTTVLKVTYRLPAPAVVYLKPQRAGKQVTLLVKQKPASGSELVPAVPGDYTLIVAPSVPGWSVTVSEFAVPGQE